MSTLLRGSFSIHTYLHRNLHTFLCPCAVIRLLTCSQMNRPIILKGGSLNMQSSCRIWHIFCYCCAPTSLNQPAACLLGCRQVICFSLASPLPGDQAREECGSVSNECCCAVLCVDALQSQPRDSMPGCKLTCFYHPTPARSMLLRGFQPSRYPNRMRSSRQGCSCSHCSFQIEAFHPAAFTLIQNLEGDSTDPLLLPVPSMSKQTSTPQEHSFTWR